ncbi:S-adenosyl-L-methionine-dependent methyltransferase [Dothidotthia symphoricarpi CBS 119687]|uniref:S-adenosyl-L-methionine-dependent methyltransferase n=1 Tax=Dothidotthia symphoricarpi CBS 119687 TaxID=1392245 RepID=A0A6A6A6B8_9PLEO|nr:S-adenosyl-L-methionine-dependent methyltransferase [Dothidotthia symphoricarpi CBS 119687]KAF2126614.1 S-adenosyl-L-methionine-dependent methyltransferase [Dothidotthia symphoricarpi CBS 119687]
MTQPTSVDKTFDTSLVDLNPSFSTTESDPSNIGTANPNMKTPILQQAPLAQEQTQDAPKQSQPKQVQHIPTQDAYDQWASVYDTDGNMLQSIDDAELTTLLPAFLAQVPSTSPTAALSLLDLGCGTGRNTTRLIAHPWPATHRIAITGLDFSAAMLDIARQKLNPLLADNRNTTLDLKHCDPFADLPPIKPVNALISTLVLEHVALEPFFQTAHTLLLPGGLALITNMHADMGAVSQAGFVNEQGVKVRGTSFAHTVQETVDEARKCGFEVLSVREREVGRGDVESGVVGNRGNKWIGVRVWFGVVLRRGA